MVSKDVLQDIVEGSLEFIEGGEVLHRDMVPVIEASLEMEEVTVITGVRRSGKTYVTFELLRRNGGIYLNFEDERLIGFEPADFAKVTDIADGIGTRIMVLDEVQEVVGWEKFAHRAQGRYKIIVTGSNSRLLSGDYSKALTGRTKGYRVHPLSYSEFLRFRNARAGRRTLIDLMETGGFPRVVLTGDRSLAREYLDRTIYRDVVGRARIDRPEALHQIAMYLLSNVGKEFSYTALMDMCGIGNAGTVRKYVELLEEAYLIETLKRYSPSLRRQEGYLKKVYAVDVSFAALGKRVTEDAGRLFENVALNHLGRKGDVFYLKNAREADFIVCDGLKPLRIVNVAYDVPGKETLDREVDSLRYFGRKYDVPLQLVTLFPAKVPGDIDHRLGHRFLREF